MFTPNSKLSKSLKKTNGYKLDFGFWISDFSIKPPPSRTSVLLTSLLFLFFYTSAFAQKKQIDSLTKLISLETIDSNKVKLNNQLAWAYFQAKQPSVAQKIVLENIEKAKKLNWDKGIANSYETIGDFYYHESKIDSSIYFIKSALTFYKKGKDYPQICYILNNLGGQLYEIYKFGESKQYLVEGYDLAVKIKNLRYQQRSLDRIGWLYEYMGNHKKSLEYFTKADELAQKMGDKQTQIALALGFANNYIALGRYQEAQKKYFEAAAYYKAQNDLRSYAYCLSSGANLYRRLNQAKKSEKPLQEVYQIQKKIQDDYNLITTTRYLGMLYTEQKRFKEADGYLQESLRLATQFKNGSDKIKALYTLERLYFAQNDFEKGDKFQKMIIRLRDSLYTADNNKALAEFDIKYKTAEKERQLAEAKLENAQKQNWIIGLGISIFALLGLGFTFHKFREAKQRAMIQEKEIDKQREILKAREIERQRIAKELHDSVGSQLTVVSTSLDNAYFLAENQRLVPQKLETINTDVREASQSLRDTIWATHNTTISTANLYARMQHYLQKILENVETLTAESVLRGHERELNSIEALNLFRIFQEAVQNIIKHAQATKINLILDTTHGFQLSITDNGRGFDFEQYRGFDSYGLANIKYRADEINALITVVSKIGEGTHIEVKQG